MDWSLFGLGAALLLLAVVDILWTTLWVDGGAGPLSSRLMTGAWATLRAVARGESRLLNLAGALLVVLTFVAWIGLRWAGWTLVHYHTRNGSHATTVGVAIFDDALTLLQFGVPGSDRPNTALVENARSRTSTSTVGTYSG